VAAGKAVFAANGCASCHTFAPANATGTIGPNLDTTPAVSAKDDNNMNLTAFIKQSIVDPNAYIAKGYPKGVMPETFKSLSPAQLNNLVAFILSGTAKS
jgi:cytochrome c oxidase subunit 2